VSIDWDFLRVAVFYGPAWVVILFTISIYFRVGQLICQWRRELDFLGKHSDRELSRSIKQSTPEHGIRRTDEVTITTEAVKEHDTTENMPNFLPNQLSTKTRAAYVRAASFSPRIQNSPRGWTYRDASTHANKATIKYCKCAMLFFLALLCTWVPSSINRIYTLIYPKQVPFGPEYAAGLVLPLQGFWNFVVYVTTSLYACRCLWQDIANALGFSTPSVARSNIHLAVRRHECHSRSQYLRNDDLHSDVVSLKCEDVRNHGMAGSPDSET
jgi:hypothetical protein